MKYKAIAKEKAILPGSINYWIWAGDEKLFRYFTEIEIDKETKEITRFLHTYMGQSETPEVVERDGSWYEIGEGRIEFSEEDSEKIYKSLEKIKENLDIQKAIEDLQDEIEEKTRKSIEEGEETFSELFSEI